MFGKNEKNICQNSSSKTNNIINPQCYKNEATKSVKVIYTRGIDESEVLSLCDECAKAIKKDAEAHGYEVEIKPKR